MAVRKVKHWMMGAAAVLCVAALAPAAQAQDFFSNFFGGFGRSRAPAIQMPLGDNFQQAQPRQRVGGGGQAFCVRTCDGRHFPVVGSDNQSRVTSCSSLCPSAETKVVYGSNIDNAATENGKPYSELPNAFRYRNEYDASCTCRGNPWDEQALARHRAYAEAAKAGNAAKPVAAADKPAKVQEASRRESRTAPNAWQREDDD